MRTKKQKEQQKQSTKLAAAGGILGGMNNRGTIRGAQRIMATSPEGTAQIKKLMGLRGRHAIVATAAGALGLGATIQNFRGSSSVGDFVKQGFKNTAAVAGGSLLGLLAPIGGVATLGYMGTKKKSAGTKKKKAPMAKKKKAPAKKGDMTFIRKNGRVIPVRKKQK